MIHMEFILIWRQEYYEALHDDSTACDLSFWDIFNMPEEGVMEANRSE